MTSDDVLRAELDECHAEVARLRAARAQPRLLIVPIGLRDANTYVDRVHRHHGPVRGHKWSIAAADEHDVIRGVAIIGRPVSRMRDDGWTLEVLRVATDGCPNACSKLYAAAWRAARAMGYRRLGSYVLDSETGTSLLAAGWQLVGQTNPGSWSRADRPRIDVETSTEGKTLWEISLDALAGKPDPDTT